MSAPPSPVKEDTMFLHVCAPLGGRGRQEILRSTSALSLDLWEAITVLTV